MQIQPNERDKVKIKNFIKHRNLNEYQYYGGGHNKL